MPASLVSLVDTNPSYGEGYDKELFCVFVKDGLEGVANCCTQYAPDNNGPAVQVHNSRWKLIWKDWELMLSAEQSWDYIYTVSPAVKALAGKSPPLDVDQHPLIAHVVVTLSTLSIFWSRGQHIWLQLNGSLFSSFN